LETRLIYTLVRVRDSHWDAQIGTRITQGIQVRDKGVLRQSFLTKDEADMWLMARAKSLRVVGPKVIAPTSVWLPFGDTGLSSD
jgi:hypothetical protein